MKEIEGRANSIRRSIKLFSAVGLISLALNGCTDRVVKTCKGDLTLTQLREELTIARYGVRFSNDEISIKRDVAAYNRAACPDKKN